MKVVEIMKDNNLDEELIHSVVSHGYGLVSDIKPESNLEKVLYTIDELSEIKIEGSYIIDVENRLNEGVKDSSDKEVLADLKGFNKKEFAINETLQAVNHQITVQTQLYKVLSGKENLARFVRKAVLSVETAMHKEAYQTLSALVAKCEKAQGNTFVFIMNSQMSYEVQDTLAAWIDGKQTAGNFLYSKEANGYVKVGATFSAYE